MYKKEQSGGGGGARGGAPPADLAEQELWGLLAVYKRPGRPGRGRRRRPRRLSTVSAPPPTAGYSPAAISPEAPTAPSGTKLGKPPSLPPRPAHRWPPGPA